MSDSSERPSWAWACGDSMTEVDLRNIRRFRTWGLTWVAAFAVASYAIKRGLVSPLWLAAIVASVPVILGFCALHAYRRYLREADELQRRIQLDGIALGFGVGVVFSFGYRLFERLGAPALDITDAVLVFVGFWLIGSLVAARRYS